MRQHATRRDFLTWLAAIGSGAMVSRLPWIDGAMAAEPTPDAGESPSETVPPTEDLMREHGLLNRILLIYEACGQRVTSGRGFDPAPLQEAASIVRRFIEGYHEELEEHHIFPLFEKAGPLSELVAVLRSQHKAGRSQTAIILDVAGRAGRDPTAARQLQQAMARFIRMYRPHEAREDTVLFPAVRAVVRPADFAALGKTFEARERQLFGPSGFARMVEQVAAIERTLGIHDLAQFTP